MCFVRLRYTAEWLEESHSLRTEAESTAADTDCSWGGCCLFVGLWADDHFTDGTDAQDSNPQHIIITILLPYLYTES